MNSKLEKFVRYVKIDTQSDDSSSTVPSSEKQKNLGVLLVNELHELGLTDAHMDEFGNVYGHLPGKGSRIGLVAHMDTALEVTGANVRPHLIQNYLGGTICLDNGLKMNPERFVKLKKHVGHDLVITDGNTLLGADDKAGVAIIMNVLQHFHDHPEEKHSTICVAFTCDEEIGRGATHFDYQTMNAKYAYTIDGADINLIECETFNAYKAVVRITGLSVHPGEGKDRLVNAINIASDFIDELPEAETPFYSSGKEGFFHLTRISGDPENATITMILRDFKEKGMVRRFQVLKNAADAMRNKYPAAKIVVEFNKQYENMKPYIMKKPMAVRRAKAVIKKNGLEPVIASIRGGTDGADLSEHGLICPNLGTGSYYHHGRFEFLDVQEFEKMIDIVTDIVR